MNFQRLLDASSYKEAHRRDMILWGEQKRQADPGFFCRKAVEGVAQPVWVRTRAFPRPSQLRPSPCASGPLRGPSTVSPLVPAAALARCDPARAEATPRPSSSEEECPLCPLF